MQSLPHFCVIMKKLTRVALKEIPLLCDLFCQSACQMLNCMFQSC